MVGETAFLKSRCVDGVLEIALFGEIDHHSARGIREQMDTLLFMHRPRLFLLSLEHITFIDSSGLGLILGRLNVARELDCEMRLCHLTDRIQKILSLSGASRLRGLVIEEETV